MIKRLYAVVVARNMEFIRDRSTFGWNVVMPLLLIIGFAMIFDGESREVYKVGYYGDRSMTAETMPFFATKYVQFIPMADLQSSIAKVERHQLDLFFDLQTAPVKYWVNSQSSNGYFLEQILLGQSGNRVEKQTVSGVELRYVDWLVPGILAMNIMFSCLFGVGYVIVRYRKNGVLKRLQATPLSAFEFLLAQVISRMTLIIGISIFLFIMCQLLIRFPMHGSYLLLLFVYVLGALSLISLGLVMAARISTEELANGILNFISWPMMLLSGVWFSLEGAQPWVQKIALLFPLTHVTEAARLVMNEGAGLIEVLPQLTWLICMTALFLTISALSFRWDTGN
ncbi:MAG TPA: ABC transporter permease [Gammaproteobacteria bacterium]|nr:ABC transporter permease [Gammaproteobacteria bacterium]